MNDKNKKYIYINYVPVENYDNCKSGIFNTIALKSEKLAKIHTPYILIFFAGLESGFGNGKCAVHKLKNAL